MVAIVKNDDVEEEREKFGKFCQIFMKMKSCRYRSSILTRFEKKCYKESFVQATRGD